MDSQEWFGNLTMFFKKENPHFETQSIFIKELYIKSALSLNP